MVQLCLQIENNTIWNVDVNIPSSRNGIKEKIISIYVLNQVSHVKVGKYHIFFVL